MGSPGTLLGRLKGIKRIGERDHRNAGAATPGIVSMRNVDAIEPIVLQARVPCGFARPSCARRAWGMWSMT
jgi:hypothetical protein